MLPGIPALFFSGAFMNVPILIIDGINKHFGGVVALKDVSFDVNQGEIVGLMGPNGAGKTTLLNIIAGEYPPDSGRVKFKGQDITGHPSHNSCRLGIARTYQIPQPFVTLSVWDHLRVSSVFGGRAQAAGKLEFDRILELTELSDKKDTLAQELPILSLKKLELARALACDPELLLLDEVAAGLTEVEIPRILTTIKEIKGMGKTIILVEHVMKVMVNAVDRIVVLDKGMKLCEGNTDDVINDCKVVDAYFGTSQ
jgi:branched-chain amino acid transport system ATP-binding protein